MYTTWTQRLATLRSTLLNELLHACQLLTFRASMLTVFQALAMLCSLQTYLIKLATPGKEKAVLLLESGVRFHTTRYSHAKSDTPSSFSMKLRKHIKAKRLEDVRQLASDRVVDFKFGSGDTCHHIILELYAGGNIILCDAK
jgi:predicted ribosome quality control (RQC) complex YloA/Tae2 family protein